MHSSKSLNSEQNNAQQNLEYGSFNSRVSRWLSRHFSNLVHRFYDKREKTYTNHWIGNKLNSYFSKASQLLLNKHKSQIFALSNHYLHHRFDFLGSGWVQVKHGMICRGLEGHNYKMAVPLEIDKKGIWLIPRINTANLAESQRIWNLVDEAYTPIDWHLDFKSGYRWDEHIWYRDIKYGHKLGVDIKVPWELARMQHLTQLCWAYALSLDGCQEFENPEIYLSEFRNQVLDFIATNPPRFGVNWQCTMDVAIRIVNWLVAYDLFLAYGAKFDLKFEAEFARSVYQHGLHIIKNLEWIAGHRTNHYLANIVGLLFVASYLPRTNEIDVWLAFAVQELISEVEYQFHPDGGNFEGSTSYHRLSAEMVVYGTALILSFPSNKLAALQEYNSDLHKLNPLLKPSPLQLYPLVGYDGVFTPFPAWYTERLEKMAEFTMHITKPTGQITQIGDNDSGRFLKLEPTYSQITVAEAKYLYANLDEYTDLPDDSIYWDENHLNHKHLVAAINGLYKRDDFTAFLGDEWLESHLISQLVKTKSFKSYLQDNNQPLAKTQLIGTDHEWINLKAQLNESEKQKEELKIDLPKNSLDDILITYAYPYFGLYLYRSLHLYIAIRCGFIYKKGNGGHTHEDQLSIELTVNGQDWITDPGTYIYTAIPKKRNQYRRRTAHFSPALMEEDSQIERKNKFNILKISNVNSDLFKITNMTNQADCVYFSENGFLGQLQNGKLSIEIKDDSIVITLYNLKYGSMSALPLSNGYGKLQRS